MTPDEVLLDQIKIKYGAFINEAVKGTPIPAALIAAIVANEAGLDEQASRFEPAVFWQLAFVAIGRKPTFGSITQEELLAWLSATPYTNPHDVVLALVNLASSWGPMQIMGYEALAGKFSISELMNLEKCFGHGVAMLLAFKKRFILRPFVPEGETAADLTGVVADAYFHCWNAGSPTGKTYDPQYADKGVARMAIYEALPPPAAEVEA